MRRAILPNVSKEEAVQIIQKGQLGPPAYAVLRQMEVDIHDLGGNTHRGLLVRALGDDGKVFDNRFFGLLATVSLDEIVRDSVTLAIVRRKVDSGYFEVSPEYPILTMPAHIANFPEKAHRVTLELRVDGDRILKLQVYKVREAIIREREWRIRWAIKETLGLNNEDSRFLYIGAVQSVGKDAPTELIFETALDIAKR
jgi:hypothetical protein